MLQSIRSLMTAIKLSPFSFFLIITTLVLPSSAAMLASPHIFIQLLSLTDLPLLQHPLHASPHQWQIFVLVQFLCLLYLFFLSAFLLLSYATISNFITASFTTLQPVPFSSAIAPVSSLLPFSLNPVLAFCFTFDLTILTCFLPVALIATLTNHPLVNQFNFTSIVIGLIFTVIIYLICILPICCSLSRSKMSVACGVNNATRMKLQQIVEVVLVALVLLIVTVTLIVVYFLFYGVIIGVFAKVTALSPGKYSVILRVCVGILLLVALFILNLATLLVLSVFNHSETHKSHNPAQENGQEDHKIGESVPQAVPLKISNIKINISLHCQSN